MSNKTLVMLGAGGHAKVCYEIAVAMDQWEQIIILDDHPTNDFFETSGKLSDVENYPNADFFVAIGDNKKRKKLLNDIQNKNYKIISLIHSSAIISPTVNVETGTVIMPGVVINANTKIGKGCILNTSCTVDHDNNIGDYVHISPGANLAGNVTIGALSWIGIGATILNNLSIEKEVILGAGSLVIKNLLKTGTYIGSPVEIIK